MVFTVRAVIEVLGFPEDHIKDITSKVVAKLKTEEGIIVLQDKIHAPEKVQEKFFSCFTEVEIKVNDFNRFLNFCYEYLPSSLEVLDSEKVTIPIREFTFGINELLEKLHNYHLLVTNLSAKLREYESNEPNSSEN